ncbi:hypothetical protein [Fodinibius sp.]|nr:hypothetical protein [Fodinibius sp.]MDZ7659921.1 hypothetical protein [Fodinibius sp.]
MLGMTVHYSTNNDHPRIEEEERDNYTEAGENTLACLLLLVVEWRVFQQL